MSDSLVELLRQRAALQAELAQLDRQIADATAAAVDAPTTPAPLSPPRPRRAIPPSNADPDAILQQYENNPGQITTDVRKGCLAYAAVAMLLLVVAAYFLLRFYPH